MIAKNAFALFGMTKNKIPTYRHIPKFIFWSEVRWNYNSIPENDIYEVYSYISSPNVKC